LRLSNRSEPCLAPLTAFSTSSAAHCSLISFHCEHYSLHAWPLALLRLVPRVVARSDSMTVTRAPTWGCSGRLARQNTMGSISGDLAQRQPANICTGCASQRKTTLRWPRILHKLIRMGALVPRPQSPNTHLQVIYCRHLLRRFVMQASIASTSKPLCVCWRGPRGALSDARGDSGLPERRCTSTYELRLLDPSFPSHIRRSVTLR
jgi:hypothetical protein